MAAGIVAHGCVSGGYLAEDIPQAKAGESAFFYRVVQIGNVGSMMFPVMDLHGARIDVRLQRIERIRQLRQLERVRHALSCVLVSLRI